MRNVLMDEQHDPATMAVSVTTSMAVSMASPMAVIMTTSMAVSMASPMAIIMTLSMAVIMTTSMDAFKINLWMSLLHLWL